MGDKNNIPQTIGNIACLSLKHRVKKTEMKVALIASFDRVFRQQLGCFGVRKQLEFGPGPIVYESVIT